MLKLKNILVPIDLSENSINNFYLGCSLIMQSGGLLHLMHVIRPDYIAESIIDEEKLHKLKINNAREELYKFINEIPHPQVNITEIIKFGEPENEILNYCSNNKIDLIIINSHGWTGKLDSIMGSVANSIFRSSSIPVICLKNLNENISEDFSRFYTTAENWVG